jgi:hypothetical protein
VDQARPGDGGRRTLDASDQGSDKARRIATNVAKPYWHCRSLSSGGSVTELSATDAYRFAVGDVLCYEIVNQCGCSKLTTFEISICTTGDFNDLSAEQRSVEQWTI